MSTINTFRYSLVLGKTYATRKTTNDKNVEISPWISWTLKTKQKTNSTKFKNREKFDQASSNSRFMATEFSGGYSRRMGIRFFFFSKFPPGKVVKNLKINKYRKLDPSGFFPPCRGGRTRDNENVQVTTIDSKSRLRTNTLPPLSPPSLHQSLHRAKNNRN